MRLLLLPGLHGTSGLYGPLLAALPSWIEPVPFDYPTDRPLHYDDVLRCIEERLPEGRFAVLGDSYSGPLALAVARRHPSRVDAVVLSVTFVRNPLKRVLRWARAFAYTPFVAIAPLSLVTLMLINGRRPRGHYRLVIGEIGRVRHAVLALRLRDAIDVDARDDLAGCVAPVLYLQARRDRIISNRSFETIRAIAPPARCVAIDGPHALLLMRAEACAVEIAAFLAPLAGR